MKSKILLLTLISTLAWIGCSKEEGTVIEAELEVYFARFKEEASQRGIEVDFETADISGYVQNIESRGTLGQCKSYSDGSKAIVVDEPYWDRIDDLQKEYIVFHELGHCVLSKDHNNTKEQNGECISIMQSGEGLCDEKYNNENRELLLNELFN